MATFTPRYVGWGAYGVQVADRAARTALQVGAGYLTVSLTGSGVAWSTAGLAAGLAVVVSLLQSVIDFPALTGGVYADVAGRALRTFAQTALGSVGAATLITGVPWVTVLAASAAAGVASLATSAVATSFGGPGTTGSAYLVAPTLSAPRLPPPGPRLVGG